MSVTQYPSGGSAVWGEITGNILDQTDTLPTQPGLVDNEAPTYVAQPSDYVSYSHLLSAAIAATATGTATGAGTVIATAGATGTATGAGTAAATATAAGTATGQGTLAATISIGSKVYTIVASSPGFDEIAQGADATEYATNIAARVNSDTIDTLCTVVATTGALAFTANSSGAAGNSITISTTDLNLTLDANFAGGVTAGTISIGSKVYTIVASGATGDQINKGTTATTFADNISAKVTTDTASTLCTASNIAGALTFVANTGGAAGNSITISETEPNLSLTSFSGGVNAGTITVGGKVYTVVASGATGDEINAGASATDYADNIATKVTTDTSTTLCTAENTGANLAFTANTAGIAGNSITLSETDPHLSLVAFAGGSDDSYAATSMTVAELVTAGGLGTVHSLPFTTDYTATPSEVGYSFDAPLAQVGSYTLTIDDGLTYANGSCFAGTNLSDSIMIVTLLTTPANLYLLDGTVTSHGAMDVGIGGSFVVRLSADGVTWVMTGVNLSVD